MTSTSDHCRPHSQCCALVIHLELFFVDNFYIYKGRGLTSATEVHWAAFFDALNIEWEYGSAGLGLEKAGWCGGLFHLPRVRAWVETRPWPEGMNPGEFWPRHLAWAQDSNCRPLFPEFYRLIVICGVPRVLQSARTVPYQAEKVFGPFASSTFGYEAFVNERPGFMWCECPCCGAVGIETGGRVDLLCECHAERREIVRNPLSERLLKAYRAAEETPIVRGPAVAGWGPDDVPIQRWRN